MARKRLARKEPHKILQFKKGVHMGLLSFSVGDIVKCSHYMFVGYGRVEAIINANEIQVLRLYSDDFNELDHKPIIVHMAFCVARSRMDIQLVLDNKTKKILQAIYPYDVV